MAGNRRRIGVALLLDPPGAIEVEGLRRALGDRRRERIAPHITLVPPLNLPTAALGDALALLRRAAAGAPPVLALTLGPVATFSPVNPVLYLAVGGRHLDELRALRAAVFEPPLHRASSWPWVPHVTVADEADPERIEAGVLALRSYSLPVQVDRVVLLELGEGREGKWTPLADAVFGAPWRVGTGGFALTLDRSSMVDPEAASVLELPAGEAGGGAAGGGGGAAGGGGAVAGGGGGGWDVLTGGPALGGRRPVVITARSEGSPVGVGAAWQTADAHHLAVWVPERQRGQGIGGHVLAALRAATGGWAVTRWRTDGPRAFYRSVAGDGG